MENLPTCKRAAVRLLSLTYNNTGYLSPPQAAMDFSKFLLLLNMQQAGIQYVSQLILQVINSKR